MKKEVIFIILGVILLLGIGTTAFLLKVPQVLPGEAIYKAYWGHICCEEGAFEPAYVRYADDVSTYKCNAYTDECHITVNNLKPFGSLTLGSSKLVYDICNIDAGSCQGFSYNLQKDQSHSFIIPYGKEVRFKDCGWLCDDRDYLKYSAKYRKFYIQGVENGKIFVHKSCILNPELRERVLAGGLNELSKTGANRCQNYITDYVLVTTNTYYYSGKNVICQARNIYEIDTLNLLDGSTTKIQGERIKSVECCPQEPNCDDDFKFKEEVIKDCPNGYDYECANGGEPVMVTGTSYVTFKCGSDLMCYQSNPVNVECTNNAICVDKLDSPNAVCKDFKCELDDEWLGHCGDGKCESVLGETATSCPEDCGEYQPECKFYETLKPARTNLFGTKIDARCVTSFWVYILIFFVFLLILIPLIILIKRAIR